MTVARSIIKPPNWFQRRFLGINNRLNRLNILNSNRLKNLEVKRKRAFRAKLDKAKTKNIDSDPQAFAKNYQLASDRFNIMQDRINNYKPNIPVNPPAPPAPVGFQRTRKRGFSENPPAPVGFQRTRKRGFSQSPPAPPAPVGFQRTRKRGYNRIELSRYFDLAEFSSPFYTRRITLGMLC